MDFHALVSEARTCRRFAEDKPLSMADLEWLADCARLAPSARNAQDLRFILVGPGETCTRLFALTRWAGALKDWGGPQPGERPTGFIALLLPAKGNDLHLVDAGIAAQTMQLAAASRGWGCCIMQAFDHQAAPQLLAVPAEYAMTLVLAFGAANEKRVLAPMPTTGNAPYWRDAQGVHYVPKRELKDLALPRY